MWVVDWNLNLTMRVLAFGLETWGHVSAPTCHCGHGHPHHQSRSQGQWFYLTSPPHPQSPTFHHLATQADVLAYLFFMEEYLERSFPAWTSYDALSATYFPRFLRQYLFSPTTFLFVGGQDLTGRILFTSNLPFFSLPLLSPSFKPNAFWKDGSLYLTLSPSNLQTPGSWTNTARPTAPSSTPREARSGSR